MSKKIILILIALITLGSEAYAQDASQNSGVRRRDANEGASSKGAAVSERALSHYGDNGSLSDADVQWMKVIYRQIDLNDDKNAALYFPEDPIEGQENLFRIMMRLLADGQINAYEYLDGREIFTDEYKVKLGDVLDRFYIPYTEAKTSTEKAPKYEINEVDVPTNEVLSYYVVERWEYDTRGNRMKVYVDAICPLLHRAGDFGGDAVKYPMFWVKFADLRPYLAQQPIFVNDDNNLPTCTYDDFFNLNMYVGEIYKTRNLKNRSLMQLHPDPDDLKHAQDSIQAYLDNFEKKLWVPDREELIAAREAAEAAAEGSEPTLDDIVGGVKASDEPVRTTKRGDKSSDNKKSKSKSKAKQAKPKQNSSSSAVKSVRRKK